jgi:hypothetical protein
MMSPFVVDGRKDSADPGCLAQSSADTYDEVLFLVAESSGVALWKFTGTDDELVSVQNEQKWAHRARAPGVEVFWEQRRALVLNEVFCLCIERELV